MSKWAFISTEHLNREDAEWLDKNAQKFGPRHGWLVPVNPLPPNLTRVLAHLTQHEEGFTHARFDPDARTMVEIRLPPLGERVKL